MIINTLSQSLQNRLNIFVTLYRPVFQRFIGVRYKNLTKNGKTKATA